MINPKSSSRIRTAAAVLSMTVAALAVAAPAGAQSISIGGQVNDLIQLGVTQPGAGLGTFPRQQGDHSYTLSFNAQVTTTDPNTSLSVADGGTGPVSTRGHLVSVSGKSVLPLPLQVSGPTGDLQSLDQPIAPVLQSWPDTVSSAVVPVELSQEVDGTQGVTSGPYTGVVLVTLSTQAP